MNNKFKTTNVLGFKFINTNFKLFMDDIKERINHHQNTFIVTANPEIVVYANKNKQYKRIVNQADYITPDGVGIIKASKILNHSIPGRISGYDIFIELLKWGNQNHKSAYFLGAKPEVIKDLHKILNRNYPNLKISGLKDGYFNDDTQIINNIKRSKPDMIFVALGYPKQDLFIQNHRKINNSLWIGLGGSFDVLSGHTQRAPKFWIDHHIEWLYRLLKEPSRFPRMMALPYFLYCVHKQKKKQQK